MPKISFNEREIPFKVGQSVLDAMIEFDCHPSYSCKKGVCQTCLLKSDDHQIASAQKDVKETLIAQGYFLACQCYPKQDIKVNTTDNNELEIDVKLISKKYISSDIVILQLSLPIHNTLIIKPGQFINLTSHHLTLTRSYSIANDPQKDKFIELHIQKVQNGKMSNWLYDNSEIGDYLKLKGPFGTCVYLKSHLNNDLILIGTGTGLAPLIGIIKQALTNNHQGKITLFHGSRHFNGLYLHHELKTLALEHDNFMYYPCLSGEVEDKSSLQDTNISQGRVNKIALSKLTQFNSVKFYLCGHPDMVKNMKKMLYLSGADLNNINDDPFEYTDYT